MKFIEKIFSLTREYNTKYLTILGFKIELNSSKNKLKYLKWLLDNNAQKASEDFIPITDKPIKSDNIQTKLLAFYLPQYYSFPLNNNAFGKGFTEWTNVTKAIPHFMGHYQPHLPYDVGFYDLSKPDVMYRQIELAKMYGIYGFCFHYYWFSGRKRLLEIPIFNYLKNKDLDMPFCLCWANENWAKLWDGGDKEVIMKQEYKKEDTEPFFEDILPFFKDNRYIKIDNKPVLIIYKSSIIDKEILVHFIENMQRLAKQNGFDGIYFIAAKTHLITEESIAEETGFEAEVEFPPHQMKNLKLNKRIKNYVNKNLLSKIYDTKLWIQEKNYIYKTNFKLFKCVFPNWDNTARKAYSAGWIVQLSPNEYKTWLADCINWTKQNNSKDEQFVFINAWNEWGEGAHLEPDQRYGYAYLQKTKEALEETL